MGPIILQNCSLWFFVLVISSYAKFYVVTFCPICFVKMQNLNCDFLSCDFSSVTFCLWLFVLWLSVLHSLLSRSRSGFEKIGRHVELCFIVCASLNNLGEGIDYSETTIYTTLFKLFALFIFFCNATFNNISVIS
jgi:hypothetical protein